MERVWYFFGYQLSRVLLMTFIPLQLPSLVSSTSPPNRVLSFFVFSLSYLCIYLAIHLSICLADHQSIISSLSSVDL